MRVAYHRARWSLLAVAAVAALCVTALGTAATHVDGLTINVTYSANSLQAKLSNGTVLSSGSVVPPGPYSVVVYDDSVDPTPQFTMTGPSVSVSSNLNPDGQGIQVPTTFGPFLLPASSSFEIVDANMGGGSAISFTTAATGSSASPDSSTKKSAAGKSLGTLAFFIGPTGKPGLTFSAKPVKTLKAGKYSMIISDQSTKGGLILGHGKAKPSTLSGAAATGTTAHNITLTPGKWYFEASTRGPKISFTVR